MPRQKSSRFVRWPCQPRLAQRHLPEVYWSARYNTILWKIRQDLQNSFNQLGFCILPSMANLTLWERNNPRSLGPAREKREKSPR